MESAAAERVLSEAFARDVRLHDMVRLTDESRRNVVLRCRTATRGIPSSFIIKKVVADNYVSTDGASADVARFFNDWVGYQFVSAASPAAPWCPRFVGGDREGGFFILEDLGNDNSLVEPLLEGKADSTEAILLRFAACLGGFHAATLGDAETFASLFKQVNPHVWGQRDEARRPADPFKQLPNCLDAVDVSMSSDEGRELQGIVDEIRNPGPFLCYVHGDPCPDNVVVIGDEVRLIDFEFGGFGHALLDATYGRMAFPSCWCANRLPPGVVAKMENLYRSELAKRCPEAQDDRLFESALVNVCGFWLFSTMSRQFERVSTADQTWGIASIRQRLIARLEAFVTVAEALDRLPHLRDLAGRMHQGFQCRWPETGALPVYAAFM